MCETDCCGEEDFHCESHRRPGPWRMFGHHDSPGGHSRSMHECGPGCTEMFGRRIYHAHRSLLLPVILLTLAEEPMHGYALKEKLSEMAPGERDIPLPVIYRSLRYLEKDGLIAGDSVNEAGRGPARKVYQLTGEGWEALDIMADQMKGVSKMSSEFLEKYDKLVKASGKEKD